MDEKITSILTLSDRTELEEAAKLLSLEVSLKLLKIIFGNLEAYKDKMLPIITGLPSIYFPQLLKEHINLFKYFVKDEVLIHKLFIIADNLKHKLFHISQESEVIERQIKNFETAKEAVQKNEFIATQIQVTLNELKEIHAFINQIIELIWLSERIDLVEFLNSLKLTIIHLENYLQNLNNDLKTKLLTIFSADDQASSIEALADLGILYPEDLKQLLRYADLSVEEEISVLKLTENLMRKIGLNTVSDFKKENIFSKENLIRYVKNYS